MRIGLYLRSESTAVEYRSIRTGPEMPVSLIVSVSRLHGTVLTDGRRPMVEGAGRGCRRDVA